MVSNYTHIAFFLFCDAMLMYHAIQRVQIGKELKEDGVKLYTNFLFFCFCNSLNNYHKHLTMKEKRICKKKRNKQKVNVL
jgi:hypothetical protein